MRSLANQAIQYGVPVGSDLVDAVEVCRWVHNVLHKNGDRLAGESPLDKYREEKFRLAQLERKAKELNLISRDVVLEAMVVISTSLKNLSTQMEKSFGEEALDMVTETYRDMSKTIESILIEDDKTRRKSAHAAGPSNSSK